MRMQPRRRYSQNFLTDPAVAAQIIAAIAPAAGQDIIEIGPGKGALTAALVASGARLTAIEIDRDLAAGLAAAHPSLCRVTADAPKAGLAAEPAATHPSLCRMTADAPKVGLAAEPAAAHPSSRLVTGDALKVGLAAEPAAAHPSSCLVTGDALKVDWTALLAARPGGRIVGNLPYKISTPLLFKLFAAGGGVADLHFMLQLEVVNRMTAAPGSKAYGRLSVMTAFHCQAEKLFTVAPGAFTPRPKVTSALVRLRPRQDKPAVPEALLGELVNHAFTLRRKTLRHSLGKYLSVKQLAALGLAPTLRAENLALDDFVRCAQAAAARA